MAAPQRTLMILGGSNAQMPAIMRAKELGYRVITCDYLPDNPGHAYSDHYENISTIDSESVLAYAQHENIDGIIAYASDPSAITAAYVSEEMSLVGMGYESTKLFCEKDLFRQFQRRSGFNYPEFVCVSNIEDAGAIPDDFFPCIVKPVDLSGSKGVARVSDRDALDIAVEDALKMSRCGRAIVEKYIQSPYCQLHGDGLVEGGEVVFLALGDQRFKNSVPIGSSLPSTIDPRLMQRAEEAVREHVRRGGLQDGGINAEVRIAEDGGPYVIEIGPRTGGNYVPQLMELATGYDEMTNSLRQAMGERIERPSPADPVFCFQYIVGSDADGKFKELFVDSYMQPKVVKKYVHKKRGEAVSDYANSSGVVGVVLLRFNESREMEEDIKNIKKHIKVLLEDDV